MKTEPTPPIPIGALPFADAIIPSKFPKIRTAADMFDHPAPIRPDIITGLLKPQSKLAIGGSSKSHKTWQLIHLGISVAMGLDWYIFPTKATKVLYVNFELHDDTFEQRLGTISQALEIGNIKASLNGKFDHWGLRGYAADYKIVLPMITQGIKDNDYGLIVLDPLYKLYGDADENKAGDITNLMNELESVAWNAKVSVVTSNHYSKGNKANAQTGDRISGSGVFQRDPDSLLEFTDQAEADENNNVLVCQARLREHKPIKSFCVKWDNVALFDVTNDHDPRKLKKAAGRHTEHTVSDLLSALKGQMQADAWLLSASANKGIGKTKFYSLKTEAEAAGLITSFEKAVKTNVTRDGKTYKRTETRTFYEKADGEEAKI
jgi:RecA-family ATPase